MMNRDLPVVRLQGVFKSFGQVRAVQDLDLLVPQGAIYGLLGPNGSGKTTTIRILMGILGADAGEVALLGAPPHKTRQSGVGYLPEERGLYRRMKVMDHLLFLARIRGISRGDAEARARGWLERLELTAWSGRRVEELSKGMQQKVQFIGTILHDPALLILDEPFSGLDPLNQDLLEIIVREFQAQGTTILLSTHLMDQAERLCDRVCLMAGSRKVLDGELRELKRREGRGVVAIDFQGPSHWVNGPEVVSVQSLGHGGEASSHSIRVQLHPGANAQALLVRGVDAGVRIQSFSVVEPRLHEIFVRYVSRNGWE
ncbi:MAG: ATP-binding cassette domain-containing protein [Gemmatimonadota bacterium]